MKTIDLVYCVPEKLVEEAGLDQLFQTARSIEKWEERHAEVLDYIYQHRLIKLLTGRSSVDDLSALNQHLELMTHPRLLKKMAHLRMNYGDRWAAYNDVIESRLGFLRSGAPRQVLDMAHVKDILDLVCSSRSIRQAEIQNKLNLKRPNLTRILNVMEVNELIERHAEGKEKIISPGPTLERILPKSEPRIVTKPLPFKIVIEPNSQRLQENSHFLSRDQNVSHWYSGAGIHPLFGENELTKDKLQECAEELSTSSIKPTRSSAKCKYGAHCGSSTRESLPNCGDGVATN